MSLAVFVSVRQGSTWMWASKCHPSVCDSVFSHVLYAAGWGWWWGEAWPRGASLDLPAPRACVGLRKGGLTGWGNAETLLHPRQV